MNVSRADYGAGHLPNPHVFSSPDGETSLKVVPVYEGTDEGKAKVTQFCIERDGNERMMWREFLLDDAPMEVLVPNSFLDYFVAINGHRDLGFKDAIVICHLDGRVVRVLELEDFLSPREISDHVSYTVSSRRWRAGASFSFDVPSSETIEDKGDFKIAHVENHYDKAILNIVFPWGKKVSIELATGKVLSPEKPTKQ